MVSRYGTACSCFPSPSLPCLHPPLSRHLKTALGLTRETVSRCAEALEAATASLSVEAQKRAAKDAQKKAAQAEKAEQKNATRIANSVVTIRRVERNKRKFVTAVSGLEAFNLDLKKVKFPSLPCPSPPLPLRAYRSCRFLFPLTSHTIISFPQTRRWPRNSARSSPRGPR